MEKECKVTVVFVPSIGDIFVMINPRDDLVVHFMLPRKAYIGINRFKKMARSQVLRCLYANIHPTVVPIYVESSPSALNLIIDVSIILAEEMVGIPKDVFMSIYELDDNLLSGDRELLSTLIFERA